jgi:hypothetical protein
MARAFSITQLYTEKYDTFEFEGKWLESFGKPEKSAVWFIQAEVGSGKTTFTAMLCKYLSSFARLAYNAIEEGKSDSLRMAFMRAKIQEGEKRIIGLDKEPTQELMSRLRKQKAPKIVVLDTIQHSDLTKKGYLSLKRQFPDVTWVIISHMDGAVPEGSLAKFIHQDAGIKVTIKGFIAFVKSRYGSQKPFIIWEEGARKFHGLNYPDHDN